MKKRNLTAVGLKIILIVSMIVMIVILVFSFSWLSSMLESRHVEADHAKIDEEIARNNIEQLKHLDSYLADNQETVERAQSIVSESSQYQHQVINDINTYASRSGIEVLGYNFEDAEVQGGAGSNSGVSGTQITNVTVTIANPVAYENFLRFLMSIEQNLTRMQITGVTMTPDQDDNNRIINPRIGLEVYLKEGQ